MANKHRRHAFLRMFLLVAFTVIIAAAALFSLIFLHQFIKPVTFAISGVANQYLSSLIIGVGDNQAYEPNAINLGIRFFRDGPSLQSSQEQWFQNQAQTNNAQFLMILGAFVLPVQPVMSQNVLQTGCLQNCNWTLNDWKAGVQNAVNAYPYITTWEIWNEPDGARFQSGYENGNALNYSQMIIVAANIIHNANPSATVVCFGGAAITSSTEQAWYQQVWNDMGNLASKSCDAISIHAYTGNGAFPTPSNWLLNAL